MNINEHEIYTYIEFSQRELYMVAQDFNILLLDCTHQTIEAGTIIRILVNTEISHGILSYKIMCYDTVNLNTFEPRHTYKHLSEIHNEYEFYLNSLIDLKFIKLGPILNHIINYLSDTGVDLEYRFVRTLGAEMLEVELPRLFKFSKDSPSKLSLNHILGHETICLYLNSHSLARGMSCTWDIYHKEENRKKMIELYINLIALPSKL